MRQLQKIGIRQWIIYIIILSYISLAISFFLFVQDGGSIRAWMEELFMLIGVILFTTALTFIWVDIILGSQRGAQEIVRQIKTAHRDDERQFLINELQEKGYLSNIDLSHVNLANLNLTSFNFADSILQDSDLGAVDLTYANLESANLRNVNLTYALLRHTVLHSAQLSDAKLSYSQLVGADLSFANLRHADFSSADLTAARLYKADIRGANFSGAILLLADMSEIIVDNTTILPDGKKWESRIDLDKYINPDLTDHQNNN